MRCWSTKRHIHDPHPAPDHESIKSLLSRTMTVCSFVWPAMLGCVCVVVAIFAIYDLVVAEGEVLMFAANKTA